MMTKTKKLCTAETVQGTNSGKGEAAYALADEITLLEILLNRIIVVFGDLQNNYLNIKADGPILEYYHDSAGVRGEIVSDYLFRLSDEIKALSNLSDSGADILRS